MFALIIPQVDSINSLLKGAVMTKACEETRHFYSDHSQPGTRPPPRVSTASQEAPFKAGKTASPHFVWTEFRQTEDWTSRCRHIIHKNIQEDPWNLPNSIKTLVESLQRFVDGEWSALGAIPTT